MIHKLWDNFRVWKIWAGGIASVGLLLIAAQCNSTPEPTITLIVKADPPEIIGFTVNPSGPVFPKTRIQIQVDINSNGHKIDNYRWVVGVGEGTIVDGNGTPLIIYETPVTSGSYEVRVELEYEGGPPVKDSTMVKVAPEPTPTPTDTPTSTPTATVIPTPTLTDTPTSPPTNTPTLTPAPTVTPIPTPTPRPTLASAPILIAPENGFESSGTRPDLIWNWDRDITQNQDYYFEITIWLQVKDQLKSIDVAWVQDPCYRYDEVPEGKDGQIWEFWWSVTVVRGSPGEEKQWSRIVQCRDQSNVLVWDPAGLDEKITISEASERRLVKVVVESPDGSACPPGGCEEERDGEEEESECNDPSDPNC